MCVREAKKGKQDKDRPRDGTEKVRPRLIPDRMKRRLRDRHEAETDQRDTSVSITFSVYLSFVI